MRIQPLYLTGWGGGRGGSGGHGRFSRGIFGGRGRWYSVEMWTCTHCGWTNHTSKKCWDKFGKLAWANAITTGDNSLRSTTGVVSQSTHDVFGGSVGFVILSCEKYNALL